jgi:hypothetical protein
MDYIEKKEKIEKKGKLTEALPTGERLQPLQCTQLKKFGDPYPPSLLISLLSMADKVLQHKSEPSSLGHSALSIASTTIDKSRELDSPLCFCRCSDSGALDR